MSVLEKLELGLTFNYQDPPMLLLEIAKNTLLKNTDAGRIIRSKTQVRTQPVGMMLLDEKKRLWMLEYNFKAYPSTEEKRHWGYVIYDMVNDDVMELFCDCKDYFYRLYYPMVKNRLARWSLNNKYTRRLVEKHSRTEYLNPTGKPIANPTGKLYCCKHLSAMLREYVGPQIEPPEGTPKKEKPIIPIKKFGAKIREREPVAPEPPPKVGIDRRFKPKEPVAPKPLAGVRIDKRFKERGKLIPPEKRVGL